MSRATIAVAAVGVSVLLAGCSFQANLTVPAPEVAALAATALEGEWGVLPEVDCGEDSVDLVVDTTVECTASNPNSGLDYPAMVTITDVDGSKYSIDVSVGEAIAPDEPQTVAPTVTPESLEGVAASALAEQLGYTPELDCGAEPIAIVLDGEIACEGTGDDGAIYPVSIVVTSVTETGYDIDVAMGADPID